MDNISTIAICGIIVVLLYVIVLGLIFADLWSGIRKARKRDELRTSEAYKRTITKIAKYFNMVFALTLVDAAQIAVIFYLCYCYGYNIPMLPIFTFIGTAYVGFVEIKSITEPANIKQQKQQEDFKRLLMAVIQEKEHPEKIMEALQKLMNDATEKTTAT